MVSRRAPDRKNNRIWLSEREGEEWIQDESGSERLTMRVEQLLGLDFDSFSKTVVLPQGRYAEFLSSKPADRRELLASILELGVYARVSERAREVAGQTKARAEALRETLTQYASVNREHVEQQRQELARLEQQLIDATQREGIFQTLMQRVERLIGLVRRQAELQTEEQTCESERTTATQKLTAAQTQLQILEQNLAQLVADREALGYDATRHDVLRRAVGHLREYHSAQQEAERQQQVLVALQNELQVLTQQLATQEQVVAAAQQSQQDCANTLQAEVTQSGDVTALTEKLLQAKRWKELQAEQRQLEEQQRKHAETLTQLQQSLLGCTEREAKKEQELRTLQQQRERLRAEEQEKARLELEAGTLGKELQEAVRDEKRLAKECEEARTAVQAAEQELQKQQQALVQAEQQEHEEGRKFEETRRQYEVEHLRLALHVGEPCPVCENPVQQVPPVSVSAMGDLAALQQTVNTAKATTNGARQTWQKANAIIAAATTRKETAEQEFAVREQKRREAQERFVGRFPGFSSLAAALGSIQRQRQELATAVTEIDAKTQTVEKEKQTLTRQREQAQREEATLNEALRSLTTRRATSETQIEALTQTLRTFIGAGDDPEAALTIRRQRLEQLELEVKTAAQQQRQAEVSLAALQTKKIQQEGNVNVIASQRDAATARATREVLAVHESLTLPADATLPTPETLERELESLTQKQQQHTMFLKQEKSLSEERDKTDRAFTALQADLQARDRTLAGIRANLERITEELSQGRSALQMEVRRASSVRHWRRWSRGKRTARDGARASYRAP